MRKWKTSTDGLKLYNKIEVARRAVYLYDIVGFVAYGKMLKFRETCN